MDWDKKFSSIVRDTETNLAKVKQRLGSARASSTAALTFSSAGDSGYDHSSFFNKGHLPSSSSNLSSFPMSYSSYPSTQFSKLSPNLHSSKNLNGMIESSSKTNFDYSSQDGITFHQPLENSPGMVFLLQDKVDAQNKAIEGLTRTIKRLEDERTQSFKSIRDLREELSMMNSRIAERGIDLVTERKVDQWRKDMMAEMQLLQTQVRRGGGQGSSMESSGVNSTITSILRDITDLKHFIQDETSSIRQDMDSLKTKLVIVEQQVVNATVDNADIAHRHQVVERHIQELNNAHHSAIRGLAHNYDSRDKDKMELSELRSSLRSLNEQINNVKGRLEDSNYTKKKKVPTATLR